MTDKRRRTQEATVNRLFRARMALDSVHNLVWQVGHTEGVEESVRAELRTVQDWLRKAGNRLEKLQNRWTKL